MDKILDQIREVARHITEDDLTCLRMEEEMLLVFIKKTSTPNRLKISAFSRIKEINRKQLELIGERVGMFARKAS